jgi:hypothetical protein
MKLPSAISLALLAPSTNAFSASSTRHIRVKNSFPKTFPLFAESDVNGSAFAEESVEEVTSSLDINGVVSEYVDESSEDTSVEDLSSDSDVPTAKGMDENIRLLQKVLIVASSTGRGQFATKLQKEEMEEMISKLEARKFSDGFSKPCETKEIEGTWELLYSSTQLFRSSPFFMAGRAVCQTEEEAQRYDWFCDMHRAALAISEIGKVRQIISSDRMVSEFEVNVGSVPFLGDFTPFKYSGGLPFTINGAIVSSADITSTNQGTAWEIFMDRVEVKGSNIPLLRSILDNEQVSIKSRGLGSFLEENLSGYSNPRPIFETTYLDETIRISRDQDGKIFVYGKMSDHTEPTEYIGVEADLGLLGLLEGLNDNFFKISI